VSVSLSEVELFFFFPVVFALYWLGPRRTAWQNAVLLLASWVFYATWNVRLLPLLWASTAIDWWAARWLDAHPAPEDDKPDADLARKRRWVLAISLLHNLGVLALFKYAGFFAHSLNQLIGALGGGDALPVLRFALPIGLSFYTFQRVGYVVDVFYGTTRATRSPLAFATFVAFFPQLIAGPIGRSTELLPQYDKPRQLLPKMLAGGAAFFLLGLFLKAYVAETLAPVVDPVFAEPDLYTRRAHWGALFGYAAQVFGDFAGYSLLAIGTGRMFGLELPQNFDYPFLSQSMPELWRRWHISLNRWLFDYIYGPLTTGSGWMRGRLDLGFVVVFLASGLWHGAMWTFILWGLLHGLALVAHHRYDEYYKTLCRKDRVWVQRRRSRPYKLVAWAGTMFFFVLTLVPFRAPSLGGAGSFALGLLRAGGEEDAPGVTPHAYLAVLLVIVYHALELPPLRRLRERVLAAPAPLRGIAYAAAIVFLAVFAPVGAGTFIYAQF
jgi:alginate O-acetyltransferase complex protein AlgI